MSACISIAQAPMSSDGDADFRKAGAASVSSASGGRPWTRSKAAMRRAGTSPRGVSVRIWPATPLHLLGFDHKRLTYRYGGRDFRLTDVHGQVARVIPA
jgi:hypothetical protein